jgi:hypothetical protein
VNLPRRRGATESGRLNVRRASPATGTMLARNGRMKDGSKVFLTGVAK